MQIAVQRGDYEMVRMLIEEGGADVRRVKKVCYTVRIHIHIPIHIPIQKYFQRIFRQKTTPQVRKYLRTIHHEHKLSHLDSGGCGCVVM
ncbi:hypothetical protein EON65_19755 [archaeon]|nr:MAG: hypothetical protein EON65_19755 [archaeon]